LSDGGWLHLVEDFVERRIDTATFHDRFFDLWRAAAPGTPEHPEAVETLFLTVEAYCPDPNLRDPGSPFEADESELRRHAEIALARLKADRR
jgi:hypothetical protein